MSEKLEVIVTPDDNIQLEEERLATMIKESNFSRSY